MTPPIPRYVKLSIVTSGKEPQIDQRNRSSGNFTSQEVPARTAGLFWEINSPQADKIRFRVMQDKSSASDPVIWQKITHNSITDYQGFRRIYVANPENATENFTVTLYAIVYDA